MEFTLEGIRIEVTKKKMKNLRIRVTKPDGSVKVSAPHSMSDREIKAKILENLDWIRKHTESGNNSAQKEPKSEGQRLAELTEIFLSLLNDSRFFPLNISGQKVSQILDGKLSADDVARIVLEAKLSKMIPLWEQKTGLYCSSWKIKNVKSYWGKCNYKTCELFFSSQLAQRGNDCIEYVVLHELAHIKYPDHQSDFKLFLSNYMPDWRKKRNKLKLPEQPV